MPVSHMRLAAFGDLHGNLPATISVLEDIARAQPDFTVCLGDLVGYGADPSAVIARVRGAGIPVVMGNYDDGVGFDRDDCGCAYRDEMEFQRGQASLRWTRDTVDHEAKAWLRTLPFDWRIERCGHRVRAVHGSPRRINEYLFEDRDPASLARIAATADCDILLFGHTHQPWSRRVGDVLLVNAGSVGKPKDGDPRACWAEITLAADSPPEVVFHRVDYDTRGAASAIRAAGLPDQFAIDVLTGGARRPSTPT